MKEYTQQNNKQKGINDKQKKILLFPGETTKFNRNLLPYNIFFFKSQMQKSKIVSNQLISKKSSLLKSNQDGETVIFYVGKYYSPAIDDVVIGTITNKVNDSYRVDIGASREASLGGIDFEGATKKTKPNLQFGDLIFARVIQENKFDNTILTCKDYEVSKSWTTGESRFGNLVDGNVYYFNRLYCWILINNNKIIKRIKDFCSFEICIGMNGKLWIKADKINICDNIYKALIASFENNSEEMEILLNRMFNS